MDTNCLLYTEYIVFGICSSPVISAEVLLLLYSSFFPVGTTCNQGNYCRKLCVGITWKNVLALGKLLQVPLKAKKGQLDFQDMAKRLKQLTLALGRNYFSPGQSLLLTL